MLHAGADELIPGSAHRLISRNPARLLGLCLKVAEQHSYSHTAAETSPATAYIAMVVGLSIRVIPPATAPPATPSSSALRAVPTATSEEEHAVSMASDGPLRPYRYDSRPGVQARIHLS